MDGLFPIPPTGDAYPRIDAARGFDHEITWPFCGSSEVHP